MSHLRPLQRTKPGPTGARSPLALWGTDMTIKTESFDKDHTRTFSTSGMLIKAVETGVIFVDAVDPIGLGRKYIETKIPVPTPETPA